MAVVKILEEYLAADVEKRMRETLLQTKKAVSVGMHKGRTLLAGKTPVDRGQMRNAWEITKDEIVDEAPHAGIIEGGARPHNVNSEGREALVEWAQRKFGIDEKDAQAVAQGVINKLKKKGQKGKFIARDSLTELRKMVVDEVETRLKRLSGMRL